MELLGDLVRDGEERKGPHHIVLGHAFRLGRVDLGDRAGEAGPALGKLVAEVVEIVVERDGARSGRVEVGSEPTAGLTNAQFQGGAGLHDAGSC